MPTSEKPMVYCVQVGAGLGRGQWVTKCRHPQCEGRDVAADLFGHLAIDSRDRHIAWHAGSAAGSAPGSCDTDLVPQTADSVPAGLDAGTAAQIIGISERAVRKACAAGRLPAERDTDGHWHIDQRAAIAYAQQRNTTP